MTQNRSTLFLVSICEILDNDAFFDIIHWSDDGESFTISDPASLSANVLPLYFKHKSYSSFVRQLHMYSFHKAKSGNSFQHPFFQRGNSACLSGIHRKSLTSKASIVSSCIVHNDAGPLHRKIFRVYQRNKSNDAKVQHLEYSVQTLVEQNEYLITQLWETRQRTQKIELVLFAFMGQLKDKGLVRREAISNETLLSITHIPSLFLESVSSPQVPSSDEEGD